MKKLLIAVLLLIASASVASAANPPLISLSRLSLAAGTEYQLAPTTSFVTPDAKWSASILGAYGLLAPDPAIPGDNKPRIAASFRVKFPFEASSKPELYVGLRYTFKVAGGK